MTKSSSRGQRSSDGVSDGKQTVLLEFETESASSSEADEHEAAVVEEITSILGRQMDVLEQLAVQVDVEKAPAQVDDRPADVVETDDRASWGFQ